MIRSLEGLILRLLAFACLFFLPAQASGENLASLIPGLYGGDGITLATTGGLIEHAPHFDIASSASISLLNDQIGSEIGVFPFSASGGGFTFSFDPESGEFVRTTETLGPLFAERALTLGRGKFNFQFAYTFFKYDKFQGQDLDNLKVTTFHDADTIGPSEGGSFTSREDFELDTIQLVFDIDIHVNLFSFAVTYGITDRLDVGVLIPLVQIDMKVNSSASLVPSPSNSEPGIHTFEGGPESPNDSASGSAFGLGDILLRSKYHFFSSPIVDISGVLVVKPPTGDEDDFLGTGDLTVLPFFALSKTFFKKFAPHINVGYEFNLNEANRNALKYVVGYEFAPVPKFTLLGDIIGSYEPDGDGIGDNTVNASLGARWNLFSQFVFSANVLLSLNDQGLRSNVIPTLAVEYSF